MKKIVFFVIVIVLLAVILNLSVSIISLWSKKDLLIGTQNHLAREESEHQRLEREWKQVNDPSFIEQQARDKLFMGQPGDVEVFLPQATPSGMQNRQFIDTRPIWLQWWDFFF